MKAISLALVFIVLCFGPLYSADICFSDEQARKLLIEVEKKRVYEKEVAEYEELVENLKKQNDLLRAQVELLKEQVQIVKNQSELYKTAYEEEKRRANLSLFEKGKWFGAGVLAGAVLVFFGL